MDRAGEGRLRSRLAALVAGLIGAVALIAPTTAMAEGGTSIASGTTVVYGQQEFGNTASGQDLKGSCGYAEGWRSYWSLPVTAGDLLTISWEATRGAELKLMPIGTTDYTVFQTEAVVSDELSSNLKSQAQYLVPLSGVMPLYVRVCNFFGEVPGPYNFTVTAQHSVSASLLPRTNVRTNSVIYGSATLASGAPVPDGLSFTLTATWPHGSAAYSATTAAGSLAFPPGAAGRSRGTDADPGTQPSCRCELPGTKDCGNAEPRRPSAHAAQAGQAPPKAQAAPSPSPPAPSLAA